VVRGNFLQQQADAQSLRCPVQALIARREWNMLLSTESLDAELRP
jgi:hypothetical protein